MQTDWQGNPIYNCSGKNYTLTKPWGTDSWDDPFTTYSLKPNYGGYGSKGQKCKYSSWNNSYTCR